MANNTAYIFRNTAFLYIRMLITIVVGFYTTRIVVDVLGVSDYGVYTLIGGLVVLFNFINDSLLSTVKRYISIGIGSGDIEYTRRVFNVGFILNIIIAFTIILLLETVVYWYFINRLNIPSESLAAAKIVFHLSSLRVFVSILQVPYSSLIVAYEKMDFFSLTSIVDTIIKLIVIVFLMFIPAQKLTLYALLLFVTSIPMLIWHIAYCRRHFKEILTYEVIKDKNLYKEILTFSVWSLFGGVSAVANKQGTNIILNIFRGVVTNAAMGIVNQVSSIVYQFTVSIQLAFEPPIMKSYASKEFEYMRVLLSSSCRLSAYMILIIAVPVIINIDYLLLIWLGDNVPPETSSLLIVTLMMIIVESWGSSLYRVIASTGDIKKYQIVANTIMLSALPIGYVLLRMGLPSISILLCSFVSVMLIMVYRIYHIYNLKFFGWGFIKQELILPVVYVILFSLSYYLISTQIVSNSTLLSTFVSSLVYIIMVIPIIYYVGINRKEREQVVSAYRRLLSKINLR